MKPAGPVARRGDYLIAPLAHRDAAAFVREHHYARGAANTSIHAHGLVRAADGVLVGAALWMPPIKRAAQSVAGENWQKVLSLSRLAVSDAEPANATSLFLAGSIRLVAQDRRWDTLLTYADTRQGHSGAIYRATNWQYVGIVSGGQAWVDPATGRQVSAKARTTRTIAQMRELGYERLAPSAKHKFVLRLR